MGNGAPQLGHASYPSALCPGMVASEIQATCALRETKREIINPLKKSHSRTSYIVAVLGWFLFKVIHDWLLLCQVDQFIGLLIGAISVAFQMAAAMSAFMWSLGASEVFLARIDRSDCYCYYQLPDFELLLAIATPGLLYYKLVAKLASVFRAGAFGDYLYFMQYDVPLHFVSQSIANPTDTLLVATLSGSRLAATRWALNLWQMRGYWHVVNCLYEIHLFVMNAWVAFTVGPLIGRLMGVVALVEDCSGWYTLALAVISLLLVCVMLFVIQLEAKHILDFRTCRLTELWTQWNYWTKCGKVLFLALHVVGWACIVCIVFPFIHQRLQCKSIETDASAQVWWAIAGSVCFLFGVTPITLHFIVNPAREALALKARVSWAPSNYKTIAKEHPEFGLDEEQQLAAAFMENDPSPNVAADIPAWRRRWSRELEVETPDAEETEYETDDNSSSS